MAAYDSFKNREMKIKKIERDLDDFGQEVKVNQIRFIPENEKIDYIGYKPKKQIEKRKKQNGFVDVKTETESKQVKELSEKILNIASALEDSERITINVSFTRWDQSEDNETDGEKTYFFIQGKQFADLHLIEDSENDSSEVL